MFWGVQQPVTCIVAFLIAVLGLLFSAFFSGAETGFYCMSRLRLQLGAGRLDRRHLRLARTLEDESGALTVTLIGTNVSNYITTAAVAFIFAELAGLSQVNTEIYTVAILTPIVFVFGEVVPKNLFQRHADMLMIRGSLALACANRLFRLSGVVWLLTRLAAVVNRIALGADPKHRTTIAPKLRVAALLQEALADRELGDAQSDLIDRVCRLSETPLHAVMVPRNRVIVLDAKADRRELLRAARRTGHARLPVYDTHKRRIVGLADIDDLLQREDWDAVGDCLEPATRLGPHETVAVAIARMQAAHCQMAVVTDRGGQMLGIVTLRDVIEEIVGELVAGG